MEIGTFTGLTGAQRKLSTDRGFYCSADASGVLSCKRPAEPLGWDNLPTDPIATVDAEYESGCGLTAQGELRCFSDTFGSSAHPDGPFTAIAASHDNRCGVRPSGYIECWGDSGDMIDKAPTGKFVDVVMNQDTACAHAADGHVECWGGFLNDFGTVTQNFPGKIAVGSGNLCGLLGDGSAVCTADSYLHQYTPPAGPFTDIAVGNEHACGLRNDGSVICWGAGRMTRLPPPAGPFVEISANDDYTCARAAEGRTTCWGTYWGDGAATLDCVPNTAELNGTSNTHPVAFTEEAGWQFSFTDVPGFRFAYDLSNTSGDGGYGVLVLDGSHEYGAGLAEQVMTDGESTPVDRAFFSSGDTATSPGELFCAGNGSTVKMHVDETSLDLKNVSSLGSCPGTPVAGDITICTTSSGCSGIKGTLDGATIDTSEEQFTSGGGPGVTSLLASDTTLFELFGNDSGGIDWGLVVTPPSGPNAGAVYCVGSGTHEQAGGTFGGLVYKLTNLSKIGACPASSAGTASGCVR